MLFRRVGRFLIWRGWSAVLDSISTIQPSRSRSCVLSVADSFLSRLRSIRVAQDWATRASVSTGFRTACCTSEHGVQRTLVPALLAITRLRAAYTLSQPEIDRKSVV